MPEPEGRPAPRTTVRGLVAGSIGLVLLAVLGAILTQATDLEGSRALHLQIEYFAVFAATSIFLLSSAKYLITRERVYLSLSIGFFAAAFFDFLHPLAPSGQVPVNFLGFDAVLRDFDGYLWWLGRVAFGIGLLGAALAYPRRALDPDPPRVILRALLWGLGQILALAVLLAVLPLPSYYGTPSLKSTLETLVAVLYLVAAYHLMRAAGLDLGVRAVGMASLLIGVLAQLFAAASQAPLDGPYFAAHGAKVISYLAVLFGLYLEHIQLYEREHRLRQTVEGAERQASRSRAELFAVVENMPDGVAITDAQGRVLHLNRAAKDILGRTDPEALLESNLAAPEASGTSPPLRAGILQAIRTGAEVRDIQLILPRTEGGIRYLSIGIVPLRDEQGVTQGTIVDLHDETELRAVERRYRELAEEAPDGIIEIDAAGVVTLFNAAAERIFGYPKHEVLGRDVALLIPDRIKPRHSEARERFFRTGTSALMGRPLEFTGLRRDGREIPIELTLSAPRSGSPRVTAIVRDVRILQGTRRERAGLVAVAQALNATALVPDLCRATAIGLHQALGYDATWVYVRDPGKLNLRLEGSAPTSLEINGRLERRLEPPDDSLCVRAFLERRGRSTTDPEAIARETQPSPGTRSAHPVLHSVPIMLGTEVVGVLQGLTSSRRHPEEEELPVLQAIALQLALAISQKRLFQELQETARSLRITNQELDSFIYTASHDLAEPLRSMSNFSQFLREDYADKLDAHGRDYVQRIHDGAVRMRELLDALLKLSRIKHVPVPFEKVDAQALLNEVRDALDALLRDRKGELVIEGPLPTVRAQRSRLMEVFTNLVTNGLKFNESAKPRVEVAATARDGVVEFTVRDNGIGIAPQYHEQIFGLFTRLHSRGQYPGTGAGLAIVRTIIEQHGGNIKVESEDGSGTTFRFTIPREAR